MPFLLFWSHIHNTEAAFNLISYSMYVGYLHSVLLAALFAFSILISVTNKIGTFNAIMVVYV